MPAVEIDGTDASELSCTFDRFTGWLCVEGVYCDSEMVRENEARALYNIPVQIGSTNWLLRCGFDVDKYDGDWMTYSLWEGYNADSGVFDRNVASLSQLAGREYRLLYPVDGTARSGRTLYETSAPMTMYRALLIKPRPLPAGIYYLDYWVKDMFMRRLPVGRAEVYWDGEKVSMLSGDSWQGEMTLTVLED